MVSVYRCGQPVRRSYKGPNGFEVESTADLFCGVGRDYSEARPETGGAAKESVKNFFESYYVKGGFSH